MSDWFGVCQLKDLPPGGKQVFDMDETMVLVTNIDGELSAIEDVCTHDGGELGSGEMDGAITMVFDAQNLALKEWIITDDFGGQTRVALSDLSYNARLDPRLFILRDDSNRRDRRR